MQETVTAARRVQRFSTSRLAGPIVCALIALATDVAAQPLEIDLRRALELAHSNNAVLEAARYRIEESRGDLLAASVRLIDNPELTLAAGPRSPNLGPDTTDLSFGLDQAFELRGQRGARIREAESLLEASELDEENARRVLDLAVATTFFEALAGAEEVILREEGEELAASLFDLAVKRLEAGEGTPLEVNTARLRRAAALRQVLEARARHRTADLRLTELLGTEAGTELVVAGELPRTPMARTEDELVAIALESRPDTKALQRTAAAARAAIDLADAVLWPGLRGGVSYEREENDEIFMASISVPLPLANRNHGERARSRATLDRLLAENRALELIVEAEVRSAFADYQRARDTLDLFDEDVLTAQEESLGLLERSLEAGEVGYAEVLVVQREVLEARADYLEARVASARARAALLAAAHLPQIQQDWSTP